jgi:hypothetical protein
MWSCGLFEGEGVSTSRESPPGPLSISYGHVGCLKASAFPPPVSRGLGTVELLALTLEVHQRCKSGES